MKSDRLLNALTQPELGQLLDALFTVLSPELQEKAIAQIPENTQQAVRQILLPSSVPESTDPKSTEEASATQIVSLAKQAQIWSELWQEWDDIVSEALEESGKYILQEVHWEPPYFDATTFSEDLERVAAQMRSLLQTAFEHEFTPNQGFVPVLLEAESAISEGLEDWMELTDGLYLENHLTDCLLQWEWFVAQAQERNAFQFAHHIRECELQFQEIELDSDTLFNFFTQLSEADQQCILTGLTTEREAAFWKHILSDTNSHWHQLYLHLVEQYAPDRYLDNLRTTIPQQWENGLPIIKALLAEQNYSESLTVIQETIHSRLKSHRAQANWAPEATLLIATSGFYYEGEQISAGQLLRYYQQTAQGLNQTDRAHALEIQQIAMAQWADWSAMFKAFAETPLAEPARQALFTSWRDLVDRRTKPQTWREYGRAKPVDSWWVPWLIDSVADSQKGAPWFQQQMTQWLTHLPAKQQQLGENYDLLRLLTKDLTDIRNNGKSEYPQFYQVVIYPQDRLTENDQSRQDYLKQHAAADLLEQVINYWKTHLQNFVPKPEAAAKSDYTNHVRWMVALKELSPQNYEMLLAEWRDVHQRRSNLWKAMKQAGLS
ncbi:hypothetical protein [Egbenema bharatensis]|uniref:hypothetical protein n=1 Tax=Egbenema bharatensis TaxID=3463334 RepID=UPI003A89D3A4